MCTKSCVAEKNNKAFCPARGVKQPQYFICCHISVVANRNITFRCFIEEKSIDNKAHIFCLCNKNRWNMMQTQRFPEVKRMVVLTLYN